jgi:hypothetical protein
MNHCPDITGFEACIGNALGENDDIVFLDHQYRAAPTFGSFRNAPTQANPQRLAFL